MNVATAHLVVDETASAREVLTHAQAILVERHHIEHATLQVEDSPIGRCEELTW